MASNCRHVMLLLVPALLAAQERTDLQQILDRLVTFSKPFGTKIAVENGVAVIRVASH